MFTSKHTHVNQTLNRSCAQARLDEIVGASLLSTRWRNLSVGGFLLLLSLFILVGVTPAFAAGQITEFAGHS